MEAYEQFFNVLKLDNVRVVAYYINKYWNTRKSIIYLISETLPLKNYVSTVTFNPTEGLV